MNETMMEAAEASDQFFNWPDHELYESTLEAAKVFIAQEGMRPFWDPKRFVEDYENRL